MGTETRRVWAVWAAIACGIGPSAGAMEPVSGEVKSQAPCGVIRTFEGDVQVLDAHRTEILETRPKAAIPCGGWLSVRGGQLEIKHRQGFEIRAAHDTFFEIYDNQADARLTGENHIVLFRGKILVNKPAGQGSVRILTPNARVTVESGMSVVQYHAQDEETQLISLDQSATLENRFERGTPIVAQAGESTVLNFKLLRLTPSTARPVDVGQLKLSLLDLPMAAPELKMALTRAAERQMPVVELPKAQQRALASRKKPSEYRRHKKTRVDRQLDRQWERKLAGGAVDASALLHPEAAAVKPRRSSRLFIEDLDPVPSVPAGEKQRILEELSRIHARD